MVLESFIQANPRVSIIVISILVTLTITLIRFFVTDRAMMREIKEKQKFIREEMKKYKDNVEKMGELNQQMLEHLPAQMKQTFKLMIITTVPILILFAWVRNVFDATSIATSWIWWYIITGLIFGIILGKVLKLD